MSVQTVTKKFFKKREKNHLFNNSLPPDISPFQILDLK